MKTFYITLLFLLTQHLYANKEGTSWVDAQIDAIKPPRVGITKKEINKLVDPFVYIAKAEKKKIVKATAKKKKIIHKHSYFVKKHYSRRLYLKAILNKSALINHKWYKEKEWVFGYKLIKVNGSSVLLQKRNKKLLLSIVNKKKNLIFQTK